MKDLPVPTGLWATAIVSVKIISVVGYGFRLGF